MNTNFCDLCYTDCLTCNGGTINNCLSCRPGYYLDINTCRLCDTTCLECTGGLTTSCTKCVDGRMLDTSN